MVDGSVPIRKILVPTDGLAHSVKACQYAVGLAKLTGAEIIGVHILPNQMSRIFEERRHLGEISHDFAGQYRKEGEEYLKQVERICSREMVRCRTMLLDGYPPEEILKIAQKENADLILIPSREEGFGLPVIEAGAARKPIFCSRIPPFQELIRDDIEGFMFDLAEDPKSIAFRIYRRYLEDRVDNNFDNVIKRFTWESIIRKKLIPLL